MLNMTTAFSAGRVAWRLGGKLAQRRARKGGRILPDDNDASSGDAAQQAAAPLATVTPERLRELLAQRVAYHMRDVYAYELLDGQDQPGSGEARSAVSASSALRDTAFRAGREVEERRASGAAASTSTPAPAAPVAVTPLSGRGGLVILPPKALPLPAGAAAARPPPLPTQRAGGGTAEVHVFWDVGNKPPGADDPRLLCAALRRALSHYGTIAGIYAYGERQDFSRVPETFLEQYAGRGAGSEDLMLQGSSLRCVLCGGRLKSADSLLRHLKQVHDKTGKEAEALSAAAAAPRRGGVAGESLGRIALYHNSQAAAFVPPAGHQLSLKYVLTREGVEVRLMTASRQAGPPEAIDRGIANLLRALQTQAAASGARGGLTPQVVVLLSDAPLHAVQLQSCRQLGVATVAVCNSTSLFGGADVTLSWDLLRRGAYV